MNEEGGTHSILGKRYFLNIWNEIQRQKDQNFAGTGIKSRMELGVKHLHVPPPQNEVTLHTGTNRDSSLKDLMPITFSSPGAQPEVIHFLISNESHIFLVANPKF